MEILDDFSAQAQSLGWSSKGLCRPLFVVAEVLLCRAGSAASLLLVRGQPLAALPGAGEPLVAIEVIAHGPAAALGGALRGALPDAMRVGRA